MDYLALFNKTETLQGRDFRCVLFRKGGEVILNNHSNVLILLTL